VGDRATFDAGSADLDGLGGSGRSLRRRDPLGVGLAVGERERIAGAQVLVPGLELAVVEQELPKARRLQAVVMAARGADLEVLLEVLRRAGLVAAIAFAEDALAERLLLVCLRGIGARPAHASGDRDRFHAFGHLDRRL